MGEVCAQGEKPKGNWTGDFYIIFARMYSATKFVEYSGFEISRK